MHFPNHLLLFTISSALASLVPGMAVMAAFTTSLKHGFKNAMWMSFGLVTTSVIYFILSGLGLIFLVHEHQRFFYVLKYLGIAYLFYLGVKSLLSHENQLATSDTINISNGYMRFKQIKYFFSGLALNFANPKNILFFIAILPQYINIQESLTPQIFWMTLASEIPELMIFLGYALAAYQLKPLLLKPYTAKYFNIFVGILFISLSGLLLTV